MVLSQPVSLDIHENALAFGMLKLDICCQPQRLIVCFGLNALMKTTFALI